MADTRSFDFRGCGILTGGLSAASRRAPAEESPRWWTDLPLPSPDHKGTVLGCSARFWRGSADGAVRTYRGRWVARLWTAEGEPRGVWDGEEAIPMGRFGAEDLTGTMLLDRLAATYCRGTLAPEPCGEVLANYRSIRNVLAIKGLQAWALASYWVRLRQTELDMGAMPVIGIVRDDLEGLGDVRTGVGRPALICPSVATRAEVVARWPLVRAEAIPVGVRVQKPCPACGIGLDDRSGSCPACRPAR